MQPIRIHGTQSNGINIPVLLDSNGRVVMAPTGGTASLAVKGTSVKTNTGLSNVSIASGATIAYINAENGIVRWAVNANAAANSAGRIPEDATFPVPLAGASNFSVYLGAGTIANIIFVG